MEVSVDRKRHLDSANTGTGKRPNKGSKQKINPGSSLSTMTNDNNFQQDKSKTSNDVTRNRYDKIARLLSYTFAQIRITSQKRF